MSETSKIDLENELKIIKEKLKMTENKLDSVMDLVYKTFNGDTPSALELSKIVGVPPPILYCDDDGSPDKLQVKPPIPIAIKGTQQRFNNRLEFLNKVMSDHDKMMSSNYGRSRPETRLNSGGRHFRVRSADRIYRSSDKSYYNPYTWNLNDHSTANMDSMYKPPISSSANSSKSVSQKSLKSRSETRQNNSCDLKAEDVLNHSTNRRSAKLSTFSKPNPSKSDFRLVPDNEAHVSISHKANRPTTSLAYSRNNYPNAQTKTKVSGSFQNLNLQSMSDSDSKTEELLKAMEKRFELSTIDLQRRLGISKAGMVGP